MYADFFSLTEKPFSITPDPAYLFLSKRHEEALAHLIYGVTDSGGFIQLTGEVGTGKTTIIRSLFEQLPDNVEIALILNPRLSVNEFLHSICEELHIKVETGASNKACFDALNPYLLDAYANGRKVVLLVDEAQNLSVEVLEQIRLLTNLETHKDKLLQIILVGQPELETLLRRQDLRQLAQRITARYYLTALNKAETKAYLKHRTSVAGAKYSIFKPSAENLIFNAAKGIPRLVNVIADRSLLGAFSLQQPTVDAKIAKKAIKEVLGDATTRINEERSIQPQSFGWMRWAWIPVLLLAGSVATWQFWPQIEAQFIATDNVAVVSEDVSNAESHEDNDATPGNAVNDLMPASSDVNTEQSITNQTTEMGLTEVVQKIPVAAILAQHPEQTTADVAFNQLLGVWGRSPLLDHSNACEVVNAFGLRCLYRVGPWKTIMQLNRPVILELQDIQGVTHQVLISKRNQDKLVVSLPGKEYEVSFADIQRYWKGNYLVIWQQEMPSGIPLAWGSDDTAVTWLRDQLTVLGMNSQPENLSRLFTADLAESVKSFQTSVGLQADGIVGSRTFIALNNALDLPGRPKLVEDK